MKLGLVVSLLLLIVLLVSFALSNPDPRVESIRFGNLRAESVPLALVVAISMLLGVAYAGLIAIAEGAAVRFKNRRLRREIQRLETENHFLRTQHADESRDEPDRVAPEPTPAPEPEEESEPRTKPSAPVYGTRTD